MGMMSGLQGEAHASSARRKLSRDRRCGREGRRHLCRSDAWNGRGHNTKGINIRWARSRIDDEMFDVEAELVRRRSLRLVSYAAARGWGDFVLGAGVGDCGSALARVGWVCLTPKTSDLGPHTSDLTPRKAASQAPENYGRHAPHQKNTRVRRRQQNHTSSVKTISPNAPPSERARSRPRPDRRSTPQIRLRACSGPRPSDRLRSRWHARLLT